MFGDKPSIADLSLAGELGNFSAMDFPMKDKFPSIYKWLHEDMMSIPGFKEVHDKGVINLKKALPMLDER